MNIVFQSIEMFSDQCSAAWSESSKLSFSNEIKNVKNVVVCGMGGSRFPVKTIKELFRDRINKPYELVEDYSLPGYVNADTLVILSSYSGTTEEVLACANEALQRNAHMSAVTSGGILGDLLKHHNRTGYVFSPTHNPSGQPRIGVGYMLMGHLGLLKALELLHIDDEEVAAAIDFAKKSTDHERAKKIADILKDTHPFIVTSEFLKGFGNGFANQINETAKMISDHRNIPELNHHLLEGLQNPESIRKNTLFFFVMSNLYSDVVQRRYGITKEIVDKQEFKTHMIHLSGQTKLAQVLEAYTLSGLVTYYLAELYHVDPSKIPWVDYFKSELSKRVS